MRKRISPPILQSWRAFLGEVGGLALIWGGEMAGLQRFALPACIVLIVFDTARRYRAKLGFGRLWWLFNSTALGFGFMDRLVGDRLSPDLFGALCALILAAVFTIGSLWRVPLVMQLAEQRQGQFAVSDGKRLRLERFFRLYTLAWALYFALRAAVFVIMFCQKSDPFDVHILLRLSLLAMIGLTFCGKSLYRLYEACCASAEAGLNTG